MSSVSVRHGSSEIVPGRACRKADDAIDHTGCAQPIGTPGIICTTPQARAAAARLSGTTRGRAWRKIIPGRCHTDATHTSHAVAIIRASNDQDQPRLLPRGNGAQASAARVSQKTTFSSLRLNEFLSAGDNESHGPALLTRPGSAVSRWSSGL